MAAVVLSQIFVEPRIKDQELKASLRDEGVQIGWPFCIVDISSEDKLFRLQRIFAHYGWSLEIEAGYYVARQDVEEIEV